MPAADRVLLRRAALVDDRRRAPRRARPTLFAASTALATLAESWPRSASSFRNLMRSLPFAAASLSRSTNTGVRLFLPALIASARPAAVSTVKPITVS